MSSRLKNKFWVWFAHKLPRVMVYYCANELGASVTTNELSKQAVCDVTLMDALGAYLKRYHNFEKE